MMITVPIFDLDPTTIQVRSRDTEAGRPTGEWSSWGALEGEAMQTSPPEYLLTFLAASQLVGASEGTVTVSLHVTTPAGEPIRTIDYEVRQTS